MAESSKQPEMQLRLRFAETDHLIKALDALPEDRKKSVTHTALRKQLVIIRDYWLKMERDRKARQNTVLKRKVAPRIKKS
jgi:hypothetical protein